MNIKQIITVGIAGMAMGVMALDNVEVTDVKARQRYPWNGKVDIDFTLDSKPTEPYQMQVEVYDNIGKTNLPVKSVCTEGVSVEANPCMVRTDTRRIVWDAAKDLPNGFKCTNVLVTCRDARLIPVDKLYCVIDLKTGTKTYLDKIPAGGWTDEHKTTKMVFRRIEAGSFMIGSPDSEVGRSANETQHKVTITKAYYIGIFEVTEGQYGVLMAQQSSSRLPRLFRFGETRGEDYGYNDGSVSDTYVWPIKKDVDPNSFIGKLRSKTNIKTLDLPTEAQWEFAARGGSTHALFDGHDCLSDSMMKLGRYEENSTDGRGDASSLKVTHVGCYVPNAYGIYDVLGNVREWCTDAWIDDLGTGDCNDPVGAPNMVVKSGGSYGHTAGGYSTMYSCRVVKGGGYYDWYVSVRSPNLLSLVSEAQLASCRIAYRSYGHSCSLKSYNVEYTREGVRLVFYAE